MFSIGASKITSKVADVGWKFVEVASRKVAEVQESVSTSLQFFFQYPFSFFSLFFFFSKLSDFQNARAYSLNCFKLFYV